ncbi:MAG: Ig-like domain-containing protein [Ruminococcus sp.]
MKTSFKKLMSVLLSILMLASVISVVAVNVSAASTVYVDVTGASTGEEDYWAWIWDTGSEGNWIQMTKDSQGYYEVSMEAGQNVVFVRMPAGVSADWDTKWNQTGDTSFDGYNNLCTITWSDTWGGDMGVSWSQYSGGDDPTIPILPTTPVLPTTPQPTTQPVTEKPTQAPTTVAPTTVAPTTQPIPTDPTEADEDQYLYVSAKSNLNTTGVKTKVEGDKVTVTYTLDAGEALDDGMAVITYDSSKLSLSTTYNTTSSMFPVISDAVYNLNAGVGKAMFNFSGTKGKYDFTGGKTLVNLVFDKKGDSVGTALVYLNIIDLNSESTSYINNSNILTSQGLSLTPAISSEAPTKPTETEIPTGESNVNVRAFSNLSNDVTSVEVSGRTATVIFNLTADEMIAFGDVVVSYDPDKLALESKYNNESSMFTTLSSGVTYKLDAGTGTMKFNFTGVNQNENSGLYDFTKGAQLIKLVFTVIGGKYGDADVQLSVVDLGGFGKSYVDNSVVMVTEGVSINSSVSDEEATTSPTMPTEVIIATDNTEPTDVTGSTEATESTQTTDTTEPTTPSETVPETGTTEATEESTTVPVTEPTTQAPTQPTTQAPTQPATQAPTQKPTSAPATQSGQSVSKVTDTIAKTDTDNGDVKGSKFAPLKVKAVSTKNKTVKLTWSKVSGAKGYIIYGANCGKTMKKLKTTTAKSYTLKNLKKGKYYKYMVVAYKTVNGKQVVTSISKITHVAVKGGKYGNATKITVKKISPIKKGKKATIKATVKNSKKNVKTHVKLRYESTNTKIATVTSKGKITAKKKGTCYVYVYAQNGVCKKVKVTVK